MEAATKLAVIDLGSNSIRLRIEKIYQSGKHRTLTADKRYIRLSENMGPEKMLQPAPMDLSLIHI